MKLNVASELVSIFFLGCVKSVYSDTCSAQAMSRCTDPLRVVTDNKDLGFATSHDELQQMCPKLMDGLHCIDNFTQMCLQREHRAYFNTLYTGTTQVIVELCRPGDYQREYLEHAPCMRKAQAEYEACADEYQLRINHLNKMEKNDDENEEKNVQVLCCSFQRYLHCSERVVNSTCGSYTANFTKGFLDRMSGPLVQGHCQDYGMGSDMCERQSAAYSVSSVASKAAQSVTGAGGSGTGQLASIVLSILTVVALSHDRWQ